MMAEVMDYPVWFWRSLLEESCEGLIEAIKCLLEILDLRWWEVGGGLGILRQAVNLRKGQGNQVYKGSYLGRDLREPLDVSWGGKEGDSVAPAG